MKSELIAVRDNFGRHAALGFIESLLMMNCPFESQRSEIISIGANGSRRGRLKSYE